MMTATGSPEFVKPSERVAVFDNDGTLWAEQRPSSIWLRIGTACSPRDPHPAWEA